MRTRSPGLQCIIVLVSLLSGTSASAQLLDYGTFSGYGLGKGILGNDYTQPLPSCITGLTEPLHASHADVVASITYSAYEYKQAFHVDQSAEASFLDIAGGSEELHIGRETTKSGSAFDIIVEGYSEHDSDTIGHVKWDPPYDKMIQSGDPQQVRTVRNICGDRFIETVFNEVRLFVVLHVSSQVSSSLTTFSGKAHGDVDIDIASASASLGGDSNISTANKSGAINIEVFSEGLGGIVPTAQALKISNADGLVSIANKLADYLGSLHEVGQPVKYQLAPLPGIPASNLTDQRISGYLQDLKFKFQATKFRLANLQSLLGIDVRRGVLKQPQADSDLHQQITILSDYANAVAVAHNNCRRATDVAECSALMNKLPPVPKLVPVELPPAIPPNVVTPYTFAIDGHAVAPNQNNLFFQSMAGSIFNAARALNPTVKDVDLFAVIPSEYISHINISAVAPVPQPALFPPVEVGTILLLTQDLLWPPYFDAPSLPVGPSSLPSNPPLGFMIPMRGTPIRVMHADEKQPCQFSSTDGLTTADSLCLTSVGRSLLDVAMADLASHAAATAAGSSHAYSFLLMAGMQDCFDPPTSVPVAQVLINVLPDSQTPGRTVGKLKVFLASGILPQGLLPLASVSESEDEQSWKDIAKKRIAALTGAQASPSVVSACSPHVQ
jgi:hypothetical protein